MDGDLGFVGYLTEDEIMLAREDYKFGCCESSEILGVGRLKGKFLYSSCGPKTN